MPDQALLLVEVGAYCLLLRLPVLLLLPQRLLPLLHSRRFVRDCCASCLLGSTRGCWHLSCRTLAGNPLGHQHSAVLGALLLCCMCTLTSQLPTRGWLSQSELHDL